MKKITKPLYDSLVQKIYMKFMEMPDMGMGEMGDAKEQAKMIVEEWMQDNNLEMDEPEQPKCAHEWDEGNHNVHRCKKCMEFSC